ncbi:hypothetical protein ACIGNX_11370 [Actinosynnema sp. NPDC053489]|uniref:ATP-dependent DNA ligase n=1 Tax=Actinosynnema sp. NPDC053489 TaxID=3363916 RepID=UPI0037C5CEBC
MPLRAESAPGPIPPMLATAGPVPTGPGWAFEFRWDGVRAVAYACRRGVRAVTRSGSEVSATYPEVRALADLLRDRDAVLDGAIVALDARKRPDPRRLRCRSHVIRPGDELLARVPVVYYAFDLLCLDGRSLLAEPYARRRRELAALGLGGRAEVRVPPSFAGADGADVLAVAGDYGLGGVVAKRVDSPYEPGRRSAAWVEVPVAHGVRRSS